MLQPIEARIDEWKRSLLDTTKRNKLIKFTTGRGGGIAFLHPNMVTLWQSLVIDSKPVKIPWKRDILRLPAEVIDGEPAEPIPESAESVIVPPVQAGAPSAPKNYEGVSAGKSPRSPIVRQKSLQELTADCLESERLGPDELVTEYSDAKLAAHLLRLSRAASEAETEHGVSTLYAAFGFLHWYDGAESNELIRSPLVLVPVRLERESVAAAWTLRAEDDSPSTNHCLAKLLAADFRVRLPDRSEIETESADGLISYFLDVGSRVEAFPRWEVAEDVVIGVFNFQKLAMWQDLEANADRIKSHQLCRAIAGDNRVKLQTPANLISASELDEKVPPETVTHILDADSSQQEAIEAVKLGADVVIDGPPGTGKSQTIANTIAELLSTGKTVLFVSEKTAALEVVKRRLDACGLGDFCLDLHRHKANKRDIVAELGRCLEIGVEQCPDISGEMRQLADERRRLNAYVAELHRPRPPLNLSAFQVHGELARLTDLPDQCRWSVSDIHRRDSEFLRRASSVLSGLARCRMVFEAADGHPWRGCRMTAITQAGLDDAKHHLTRIEAGATRLTDGVTLAELALQGPADTIIRWKQAVAFARSVLAIPIIPKTWFSHDPFAAATAAVELHSVTLQSRRLVAEIPMFSEAAVLNLTGEASAEIKQILTSRRELLLGAERLFARQRLDRLKDLAERLTKVCDTCGRLKKAFKRLLAPLLKTSKHIFVSQTQSFAQFGAELASGNPIPTSWWDANWRVKFRSVIERAAQEDAAASDLRTRLAMVFSPAAFTSDAGPIVRDALQLGSSFWRWLSFRWRTLHRQLMGWYVGSPSGQSGIIAELRLLDEFHRRSGDVKQIQSEYATDVLMTASGKPDWAATLAGLNEVERYDHWMLSEELKAALAPGGNLDRASLAIAAEGLKKSEREFKDLWNGLLPDYAPANVGGLDRTFSDLSTRLVADVEAARTEIVALERLISLLCSDQDLPSSICNSCAIQLHELITLRAKAVTQAKQMGFDVISPIELESKDWSAVAAVGSAFREFLSNHRPLSPTTVIALWDETARERVLNAIEVSESVISQGIDESWQAVAVELFPADVLISDGLILSQATIPELGRWATRRLADLHRAEEWIRYQQIRMDAVNLGIESVLDDIWAGRVRADSAADAFRRRFLGLWLDSIYGIAPELARFVTDDQDARVERFSQLDRLSIRLAPVRLRARLLSQLRPRVDDDAPATSELGLLMREVNKRRRHLPLRRLFAEIPTLLPRLKPCLMMSPLAVSTYLNPPAHLFDVVIFDEASQVRPHDAVSALYRGKQLVVAGDPQQLPPTDFFSRSTADDSDEDESTGGTAGFESLLDVCLSLGLVRKRLRWHYRSRREGLIAFSNRHFYENSLVTFPSVEDGVASPVQLVRVPGGTFLDGVNAAEARRVAGLVLEHFKTSSGFSLGVIAFSQRQQNRILDELEILRKLNPQFERFFNEDRPERFFVKNLENVQGDERDVILLSVGYGPDTTGKVAMRFGPLNRTGGERRLNVAITRARIAMVVVTSMTAADIDPSRTQSIGARLLRAFLDYAERGTIAFGESETAVVTEFDSPFEQEVLDELRRRGLTVHHKVGCSGYKIDIAVVDNLSNGRYVLGVECDGVTYHASATARDRDRLRQTVLEGLGWKLCRIWSTDWLRNRDRQINRVFAALEEAARPRATPSEPVIPVMVPAEPKSSPPPASTQTYLNIDDVPELVIRTTALSIVAECGATEADDLFGAIARRIGFKRLGGKIRARIESSVAALAQERRVERQSDGRWGPPSTAAS